ncbi:MAG: 16S rRNA (guanine(966)-N(2))-methyltransferase RsmD [Pseudomonadota bacterium]
MPQGRTKPGRLNQVRIIGGQYRRRLLHFPDVAGLRPTPDRVRETLFNWLGQDLTGLSCLDAFAGSGALGFEALSRGAARVLLLDRDARVLAALRESARELGLSGAEILAADGLSFLAGPGEAFDVIFLDPPFASDLLAGALRGAATRLRPGGRIYAESPRPLEPQALADLGLALLRQGRAGASYHCLLEQA